MSYRIVETENSINIVLDEYPDNVITVNWVKFEEDTENDCLVFKFDYDGTNDPVGDEYKPFVNKLGAALFEIVEEQSKEGKNYFRGGI